MNILKTIKAPFKKENLERKVFLSHMFWTYFLLRMALGIVTIALPFIFLWRKWTGLDPDLLRSISVYYYSDLKAVFLGVLLFTGMILMIYKGYTKAENIALNIAGGLAWCIALFPTQPIATQNRSIITVHNVCAVLFFLCIAYVCIYRSKETVTILESEKTQKWFKLLYNFLGGAMVGLPLAAWLLVAIYGGSTKIFWIEAAAIWVFGIFWIMKSFEIKISSFGLIEKGDFKGVLEMV